MEEIAMGPMSVMLKPASGMCNMRCRYCFYADEAEKRTTASYGIMSLETLEAVLKQVLSASAQSCTILFQGGEPTLAGLPFFEEAVRLSQQLNRNGCRISFALQTNGLLIDEEWCRFLAENRFLVGVSLDGTKDIHDANRVDASGNGTYSRVMRALQLLGNYKVDTNILTVITSGTAQNYQKIYNFYARNGYTYQQYIPCLDPLGEERGQRSWSLTPARFEMYLKTAFDCWYRDAVAGRRKYHRYFDNLLMMLHGQPPETCGMLGQCGRQYVVEADGGVYPCDFYMLDQYLLGNLRTDTIAQIDRRRRELGFIQESAAMAEECLACQWRSLCRGGCRRDRDYFAAGLQKNYYCAAYRGFFPYAYPRLVEVYRRLCGIPT